MSSFSLLMMSSASSANQGEEGGSLLQTFLFMAVIVAVFWFFMIRPQKKKQKQREEMLQSVSKGDMVITIGGIHGFVAKVSDSKVLLKIDSTNSVRVEFARSAIAEVFKKQQSESGVEHSQTKKLETVAVDVETVEKGLEVSPEEQSKEK